jgi:hypothetical protein
MWLCICVQFRGLASCVHSEAWMATLRAVLDDLQPHAVVLGAGVDDAHSPSEHWAEEFASAVQSVASVVLAHSSQPHLVWVDPWPQAETSHSPVNVGVYRVAARIARRELETLPRARVAHIDGFFWGTKSTAVYELNLWGWLKQKHWDSMYETLHSTPTLVTSAEYAKPPLMLALNAVYQVIDDVFLDGAVARSEEHTRNGAHPVPWEAAGAGETGEAENRDEDRCGLDEGLQAATEALYAGLRRERAHPLEEMRAQGPALHLSVQEAGMRFFADIEVDSTPYTVVVGILASMHDRVLLEAVRATYLSQAFDGRRIKFLFLLDEFSEQGGVWPGVLAEAARADDIVLLPTRSAGRGKFFGEKLFRWFQYAYLRFPEAKLVVKADLDMYMCPANIVAYAEEHVAGLPMAYWGPMFHHRYVCVCVCVYK